MLKKMMLLALMALAATAFAIPTSASADQWIYEGAEIGEGEELEQAYEGVLSFNTGPTGAFGCQVTAMVITEGPEAGRVTSFSPTTGTCTGTIAFKGCVLAHHTANVPWRIGLASTPLVVTKPGGNLTIHNEYLPETCAGKQTTSHLEFKEIKAAVEGTNPITKLVISGTATNGVPASGSLTPEGTARLGIK